MLIQKPTKSIKFHIRSRISICEEFFNNCKNNKNTFFSFKILILYLEKKKIILKSPSSGMGRVYPVSGTVSGLHSCIGNVKTYVYFCLFTTALKFKPFSVFSNTFFIPNFCRVYRIIFEYIA